MENPRGPVVLVDDDASVRTSQARLFRSAGIDLKVFSSAEEFLAASAMTWGSCLIVDVQMPGMTGLELQTKCAKAKPSLPVIMITAFPDPQVERQALSGGAVAFLNKPFDGEELLGIVRRCIGEQGVTGADTGGSTR